MPRTIHKRWQNKRPGWTHRITWYQGAEDNDIRLQYETTEGKWNVYPDNEEEAEICFQAFKVNYASIKFGSK